MGYPYGTVHGVAVGVTLWGAPMGGRGGDPMGRSMGRCSGCPYGSLHGVVNEISLWGRPWGGQQAVLMGHSMGRP